MANDTAAIRAWAQANGYEISDRGRIAREIRDAYNRATLAPLPADGDEFEIIDGDDVGLPPLAEPPAPEPGPAPWWEQDTEAAPEPGPVIPDPAPAKIGRRGGGKSSGRKPTAAVAQDIRAKVGMMVDVPARLWAVRDPVCGVMAVQQSAAMADAWTAIVLDSPELVAWFSGPAGGFMKWVDVIMATYPVAMTVYAHHIARTVETPANGEAPRADRQYAA